MAKVRELPAVAGLASQIVTSPRVIKISAITLDPRLQQRVALDEKTVEEYVEVLKGGGELAPVSLINENGKLWLWDGWHTIEAHRRVERDQVKVRVQPGTFRDAWIASLGANHKHGRRRTSEDKEKALKNALSESSVQFSILNEDGHYSFRKVAKWTGWSHTGVSNYWKKNLLPGILQAIDKALTAGNTSHQTDKLWMAAMAKELHVPDWLVEQREIELKFNLTQQQELDQQNENNEQTQLDGGNVATRQITNEPTRQKPNNDQVQLEVGNVATRQLTNEPRGQEPNNEQVGLEGGNVATRQLTREQKPNRIYPPLIEKSTTSDDLTVLIDNARMMGGEVLEVRDIEGLVAFGEVNGERVKLPVLTENNGDCYLIIRLKVR